MPRIALDSFDKVCALADILLAAAHSDHIVVAAEASTIRSTLCEAMGVDDLPSDLARHIARFDPRRCDVEAAVMCLGLRGLTERRALLCYILRVADADGVVVDAEDEFLEDMADLLELPPEELMCIEYER